MTISIATCRIQYSGNGVLDTFAYDFRILAAADLKVIVSNDTTGAETVLVLNTNYTVTGAGSVTGGNVILTSGSLCPTGSTLTIKRNMAITQTTDWVDGQAFSAQSIEDASDKVTMAIQQVNERLGRTPYLRDSYPAIDFKIPNPEASKYLGWNPAATALENKIEPSVTTYAVTTIKYLSSYASFAAALSSIGSTTSTLVVDTSANITVDTVIPATLQVRVEKIGAFVVSTGKTLTINGAFSADMTHAFNCVGTGAVVFGSQQTVYPEWWGAAGDGITDDSAAIQAALTAASGCQGGGKVMLSHPSAYYSIGTTTLEIPNGVTLEGEGFVYPNLDDSGAVNPGPEVLYSGSNPAVVSQRGYNDVGNSRNVGIRRLKIRLATAGATGVVYAAAKHCFVDDVVVSMAAASQTGMRMLAEKTARTYSGNFYNNIKDLSVKGGAYAGSVALSLTGASGNGQNNANVFINFSQEACDKGIVVGPSSSNRFYGVTLEDNLTTALEIQANALGNKFDGVHVEGLGGTTAFDILSGASFNIINPLSVSAVMTLYASSGTGNAINYKNIIYSESAHKTQQCRDNTDAQAKSAWGRSGFYNGDGITDPTTADATGRRWNYLRDTISDFETSSANPTVTPDCNLGYHQYINMAAGTTGTLTIAAPTNSFAEGEIVTIEIMNNSGAAMNLAWNASYIKTASLATYLTALNRYTVQFRRHVSTWVILGAPFKASVTKIINLGIDGFPQGAVAPDVAKIGNFYGYEFDVNDIGHVRAFKMPYDWDGTTSPNLKIHWYCNEAYATNSGEVRWNALYNSISEAGEAVDPATKTLDFGDVNIPATAKHLIESTAVLPVAELGVDEVIGMQIKNVALVAGTSPTAKPTVISVGLEYVSNKLGE